MRVGGPIIRVESSVLRPVIRFSRFVLLLRHGHHHGVAVAVASLVDLVLRADVVRGATACLVRVRGRTAGGVRIACNNVFRYQVLIVHNSLLNYFYNF